MMINDVGFEIKLPDSVYPSNFPNSVALKFEADYVKQCLQKGESRFSRNASIGQVWLREECVSFSVVVHRPEAFWSVALLLVISLVILRLSS